MLYRILPLPSLPQGSAGPQQRREAAPALLQAAPGNLLLHTGPGTDLDEPPWGDTLIQQPSIPSSIISESPLGRDSHASLLPSVPPCHCEGQSPQRASKISKSFTMATQAAPRLR